MATHSSILAWGILEQKSLVGYSPQCCKESDMTEQLTLALSFPSKLLGQNFSGSRPALSHMVHICSSGNPQIFDLTDSGRLANPGPQPLHPSSCRQLSRLPLLPALLGRRQSQATESPSLQRTFNSLPKWPQGGPHSCFKEREMSSYLILSLKVWNSKHNSSQRHFPLKSSINPQFLHLFQYFMPSVQIQSPRILSHRLDLGLSPL